MNATYKPENSEALVKSLEELKRRWLGNFSTNLPCNCRHAPITDHATDEAPPTDGRLGPGPYWKLRNFKPVHNYWCDRCGAVYKAEVIEGARGYVPLERRPFEQACLRVAADI